ncbi:MAG TPA: Mg2+ and Co2+ transporter CorB, partial [Nitrosomonas sp.]|nr:Mg2+ and Co2+ transporter CorB [Nitrosomonas sp.]
MSIDTLIWIGILFCISQSAMFSGLNLALLGISRLHLEVDVSAGNTDAAKILVLRKDFNFLLATILWGNVGINVLLTLLSNSVMAGLAAFFFSTILITFAGEIFPQAYFSRHAMRMGALLAPLIRIYQAILFPVAKPSAMILDWWLGKESIPYFRERDLRTLIRKHIEAEESDVERLEGIGALNFLALDDISV